jgi:ribosomal protein S18 acetylase RimI-like enzyme
VPGASLPAIRAVTPGEEDCLPRVLEILKTAFAAQEGRIDPPSGVTRETLETLSAKLDRETLLVAELGGRTVGCIWCDSRPGEMYIGRLAVEPASQGRGVARSLLLAAIRLARESGVRRVTLGVRIELEENIAFFRRHGFQITGTESHPGFDRPTSYDMALELE